jgi:PAS domain S-box-containing protein
MSNNPASPLAATACESEPIRFPAAIQPHGALLVVAVASGLVEAASESCQRLLGRGASSLIGLSLRSVLGPGAEQALLPEPGAIEGGPVAVAAFGGSLVATASLNEAGQFLVAIEPGTQDAPPQRRLGRHLIRQWRALHEPAVILDAAVRGLREMTGFDRVMVYRFDEAWNGEVLAESRIDSLEPFLGLHYPAGDIPQQARELYRLIRVRAIPDVDYQPSHLMADASLGPVDLGTCGLRSVSPMHLAYCHNMGVRATLVVSLLVEGRLWGLLACHHYAEARHCGPAEREEVAGLCDDLAELLALAFARQQKARQQSLTLQRHGLVDLVRAVALKALARLPAASELIDVVNADGFALVDDHDVQTAGVTPSADRIRELVRQRRSMGPVESLFATHRIGHDLGLAATGDGIAGALFVSLSAHPKTMLIWFRSERAATVRWAGDPRHAHALDDGGRIMPRKSFRLFVDHVGDQALPWSAEERASAAELASLIEIDALRQRKAQLRTVLDSIPQHLCVLNNKGVVVTVNRAWRELGSANGELQGAMGLAYQSVCGQAEGVPSGEHAEAAWAGIQSVLDRSREQFLLDYPGRPSEAPRWFQLCVFRMQDPGEGVVVTHADITVQKRAWLALEAAEKRYRDVVEAQTDSVLRLGPDGCVLFANDAACRVFERPLDQLLGASLSALFSPDDLALYEARLRSATPAHPTSSIEMRTVTASGVQRWQHIVSHAVFDDQSHLVEVQAVGRDTTERKASEAQVQRLLREQQAILNSPVVGIFKLLDRKITWANAAFADIHGYAPEELPGMSARSFFASDEAVAEFVAASWPVLLAGQIYRGEVLNRRKDGQPIWVEISMAMLDHEQKELIGALVNISHLKAAEAGHQQNRLALEELVLSRTRALAQARDEAQAANRAKSVFLTTMSHELRTPMNAFMGMTQLALKRAADAKQAEQLGKALTAAQGLLVIINDILELSRIDAGKVVLALIPFDLSGAFATVEALTREQATKAGLQFALQVDPELQGQLLLGDSQRLGQVLLNLVTNAIKFTARGSVQVRALRLDDLTSRIRVRFEVQDTGIGIAVEDQDRIFKAFEQADGSITRLYGGSGLGLSICRRLVTLMGGEIGLQSDPGVGSTFWFVISLDRVDTAASPTAPVRGDAAACAIRSRHSGVRLLVVDDEPVNREVTRSLLEDCGLRVEEAEDGMQAVEMADRVAYALILMDMQMPRLDGCAATRRIRASAGGARVPIAGMTANVFQEDQAACRAAGMDDFIGKPMQPEQLIARVQYWLDRKIR